jgi:hypothetical protein
MSFAVMQLVQQRGAHIPTVVAAIVTVSTTRSLLIRLADRLSSSAHGPKSQCRWQIRSVYLRYFAVLELRSGPRLVPSDNRSPCRGRGFVVVRTTGERLASRNLSAGTECEGRNL